MNNSLKTINTLPTIISLNNNTEISQVNNNNAEVSNDDIQVNDK